MGQLRAVTAAVVVVFLGLGLYAASRALGAEGRSASRDAAARAGSAATAVQSSWALMAAQVASLSTNPELPVAFEDPSGCDLSFSLDLLPDGHIDLVSPSGKILCSSHALPRAGVSQSGAPWLARLASAKGVVESKPFRDAVTGSSSVAVVAPVNDRGRLVGAVAAVAPLRGLADGIASELGDSHRYTYTLVDSHGAVLSAPGGREGGANPVKSGGDFYGSAAVPGLGWTVFAGVSRASALGPTRELLIEEAILAAAALAFVVFLLMLVRRRIAVPLGKLADVVADSGPHVDAALASLGGSSEVSRLATAFAELREGQAAYEAQLAHRALHDPLTGLANRALLSDRLGQALAERDAAGPAGPLDASGPAVGVLYLDVDRFGLVNESLGHAAGDRALAEVAERLQRAAPAGSTVARFGGDEFVIICGSNDLAVLTGLAERAAAAVAEPLALAEQVVRLAVSGGIAVASPSTGVEELLRESSEAMYRAKQRGGARWESFQPGSPAPHTDRLVLETELRVAVERGELHVFYQPKVDLASGDFVGVEALIRWMHPGLGSVPPATFIPIAEQTGMIESIGRFVLDSACRQAAAWRQEGIEVPVAVNLSARQLDAPDLVAHISSLIERYRLAPDSLWLELTETALMLDPDRAMVTLHALKALGVNISVDDFGTGYSSLAYLQRFPVDEVKIDRTFTSQLVEDPTVAGLVDAIIAMAAALRLQVTAEGVETPEQAEALLHAGCGIAQGFLYARPADAEATQAVLRRRVNAPAHSPHD